MKYNIYAGHKQLQSNLSHYKNQILNYFKSTYNDCFVPSFMNNKTETLNRNKHAGAHICVSSFESQQNGFRRYNTPEYYYVTKSQVNIVNHYYFSLSKSVVENAESNNKFMFLTANSLFVCDKDFIIGCINKTKDIKNQLKNINNECYYIPFDDCEMIPYDASTYFGFYNASQWKPTAIGFYNGKVAGNRFNLIFPNLTKEFSSVSECYRWIEECKYLTYTKSERTLSGEIKNKGEVKFAEGTAKVEWICGKLERNTSYETVEKRRILTDEEVQNKKEWEEFERKTIEELENKDKTSLKDIIQDKKEKLKASDVIIKSKYINNNIIIFNNNIGSKLPRVVLDNKHKNDKYLLYEFNMGKTKEQKLASTETTTAEETFNLTEHCATEENHYKTWEEFCQSKEVANQLKRRPRPKDWLDYKHNRLVIKEDIA